MSGPAQFVHIVLRTGFGYEPSPLVKQGTSSNFLDSDRMLFAGGRGITHMDPFEQVPGPVAWDLFFTHHTLASGSLQPEGEGSVRAGSPIGGRAIPIGGNLWSTGMQWSVEF